MGTEDSDVWLHDLVPAIVARSPDILAEVRNLLAEQQPDYAGFLAGTSMRFSAPRGMTNIGTERTINSVRPGQ